MLAEIFSGIGYADSYLMGLGTKAYVAGNKVGDGISSLFKSSSSPSGKEITEEEKKEAEEAEKKKRKEEERKLKEMADSTLRYGRRIFGPNFKLEDLNEEPKSSSSPTPESTPAFPTIPDNSGMNMPLQKGVTYAPNPFLGEAQQMVQDAEAKKVEGSVPTPAQLEQAFADAQNK